MGPQSVQGASAGRQWKNAARRRAGPGAARRLRDTGPCAPLRASPGGRAALRPWASAVRGRISSADAASPCRLRRPGPRSLCYLLPADQGSLSLRTWGVQTAPWAPSQEPLDWLSADPAARTVLAVQARVVAAALPPPPPFAPKPVSLRGAFCLLPGGCRRNQKWLLGEGRSLLLGPFIRFPSAIRATDFCSFLSDHTFDGFVCFGLRLIS